MLRPLLNCARGASRSVASRQIVTAARPVALTTPFLRTQALPATAVAGVRCYASGGGMSKQEVEGRILDLLKGFDKVKDASKLSNSSHFSNDLGLDSLDTVEVVMAIEEEFSIEIPDKEADAIHSVDKAVEYIMHQPDG